MLNIRHYLKGFSTTRQYVCHRTNYGANYSQRCDVDDCGRFIPQPKCGRRPKFVREVDCEKCIFESWSYKPRPKFPTPPNEKERRKQPKDCSQILKDPQRSTISDDKKKAELCQYMNRADGDLDNCPKYKECEEKPLKLEDENIPLPDWDFSKKRKVP